MTGIDTWSAVGPDCYDRAPRRNSADDLHLESAVGPFLQVGGQWEIVQKNGYRVLIDITQDRDQLSAFASHSNGAVQSLEATGFVSGPNFEITITWNNGTKGEYKGQLTHGPYTPPPIGFLKGHAKDLNNPGSETDWESDGRVFRVE